MSQTLDKLIRAKTSLILDFPFFGSLICRFSGNKLIETDSIPTMATDGTRLLYNPKFVDSLSLPELLGVLCHEVLHCSQGHPWREGAREHVKWNHAADYAINPIVIESGLSLPDSALLNKEWSGKSAEEIYNLLPVVNYSNSGFGEVMKPGAAGEGDSDGNPNHGGGLGSEGEATQEEWRIATVQAAQAAKMRGKLPASIARLIDEIVNPKVDWRAALQNIVQQALARDDYSWQMPNNRYLASGIYMPSLRSERIPPIVIGVDTSGSIGAKELAEFAAEINAIAAQCKPEAIHVVYCDAAVNRVEEYMLGELIDLKPVGGGGTDFRPVFDYVDKEGIEPACLIYLTDMYGEFPENPPAYPVVWAAIADLDAPFGTVIDIS